MLSLAACRVTATIARKMVADMTMAAAPAASCSGRQKKPRQLMIVTAAAFAETQNPHAGAAMRRTGGG
jgi:hypothetical protein